MTKVLYVHNTLGLGGVQSVRYMYLKNLRRNNGLSINILCLGKKGEFGEKIEELGYKVDAFNRGYGLLNILTTWRLVRYIRKHRFDIVHSALFYANFHSAIASRLCRLKTLIIEEHGEHNLHWKKKHFVYRIIGRLIARMSNAVLCCSDFVKDGVRRMYGLKEEKLCVFKNLVEDKRLQIRRSREEVRDELGISRNNFVVGTVSSLYWIKNQRILIDILSRYSDNEISIVIVGDGPLKRELKEYAGKKGLDSRVHFCGWRRDVADLLNSMDVFILPSLSEGLPVCLLEAMSIGLPCIASRVGGIEEVLQNGINGITVKPNDIDELDLALNQMLSERGLASSLGASARRYVNENFRPESYVNLIINLYSKLRE